MSSNPSNSGFGFESTADDVAAGIDLSNRWVVITGGGSGLGAETARALKQCGAKITLLGRTQASLADTAKSLGADYEVMDLADLHSVKRAAEAINARDGKIDILINNAGIMACPEMKTEQGLELQFGTNHIGHFLFTKLLLDKLRNGGRVVNLSSAAHRFSGMDFDDIQFEKRAYDKWVAYGQSKTANVLFSVELNKRLADRNITANAVHPGGIMTDLGRHLTADDITLMRDSFDERNIRFKSIPQGAATTVWVATSSDLEGKGGLYCEDCNIAERNNDQGGAESGGVMDWALDEDAAAKLWDVSEEFVADFV